jgi:ABC-type sugar transport system ATPase subunit
MAFSLKLARAARRSEIEKRVARGAEILGLEELLDR